MTENAQIANDEFVKTARQFCDWVEAGVITDLQQLQNLLAELHYKVLQIPPVEPNTNGSSDREVSEDDYKKVINRLHELPIDSYWEVLEPFNLQKESVACGSLVDDVADIWRDLKNGLLNHDHGRINDALFDWVTTFETHWGNHLTHAQRILHQYLY